MLARGGDTLITTIHLKFSFPHIMSTLNVHNS